MANVYDSRTIVIDTFSGDLDLGDLCFGLTNTPFLMRHIIFSNPTAADVVVLKNARGEVVTELVADTTGASVGIQEKTVSEGLKILTADQTVTTGKLLIHLC